MLLHTGVAEAAAVTVVVIRGAMEAALGPVAAGVLGVATATVPGAVVAAPGLVMVAGYGGATVALPGAVMVTDFTATGVFLVRVLDSSATVTLGTIIPITLIRPHTMAIPTMTAGTMAIRITVVSTTKGLILARLLPSRSKPRSHDVVIIADRLTVSLGR
jgi:hypothetical protein